MKADSPKFLWDPLRAAEGVVDRHLAPLVDSLKLLLPEH